jgi:hypothetical protein
VARTRGKPNPVSWSFVGGLTGEGLFANRPYDGFGMGFYTSNWSRELDQTVDAVLPLDGEKVLGSMTSLPSPPGSSSPPTGR